jgi:hypothetical protein
MKIYFEQSGGLTGIDSNVSIDSDLLQPEEKSELQHLIDNTKFFDLPSQPSAPSSGADYLEYKITIETNDNMKCSFNTTDLTMPSTVGPLIRYLRQKAIKHGLK